VPKCRVFLKFASRKKYAYLEFYSEAALKKKRILLSSLNVEDAVLFSALQVNQLE
jgi:hypothetical protein